MSSSEKLSQISKAKSSRFEALLSLYEKDPKDSFVKYGLALEYLSLKEYPKAAEFFKLIIEEDPSYIPAYMLYAQMQANQNNIEEAKLLFQKGIEIARQAGDSHAANEMEEFLDELE